MPRLVNGKRWSVWKLRDGSFKLIAVADGRNEAERIALVVPGSVVSLGRPPDPEPRSKPYLPSDNSWGGKGTE